MGEKDVSPARGSYFPAFVCFVMEYLSRVLTKMGTLPDFQFHPMSKGNKLTHLIFADDVMILCKGNMSSVSRVMEALHHCLVANLDKSNIFIAGVEEGAKQNILAKTGFLTWFPTNKVFGVTTYLKEMEKNGLLANGRENYS